MYLVAVQILLRTKFLQIFVKKLYLRANYTEANIEQDFNMKNQFINKNFALSYRK